jgi:hypothetical protein
MDFQSKIVKGIAMEIYTEHPYGKYLDGMMVYEGSSDHTMFRFD